MDILAVRWKKAFAPKRILAIRLQAMGDLVITLPYLQQLRNTLPPDTVLDLLTREEVDEIPKHIHLFNRVYSIRGGRNVRKQFLYTSWMIPRLFIKRYDVVIDLQDNIISRLVSKSLMPKAWSLFDRLSPVAAGERTRMTIEAIGLGKCFPFTHFSLTNKEEAIQLLRNNGWKENRQLVILNPAGAFESRNWPLENYVKFAELWLVNFPDTQFLLLGTDFIASKSAYLAKQLGNRMINLVNKTTPAQAFAIVQEVKFVLSEDSGLMHMAWVSGIPTMALFGSTQSEKARPLGETSRFVDSNDLECGSCMQVVCRYGDTHCLTRYTAEMIFEKSIPLLQLKQSSGSAEIK